MIRPVLLNFGWRYLLRHPWQTALMILGITLGVAVVVAVDLANASASQAFQLSTTMLASGGMIRSRSATGSSRSARDG